jgi:hypothetical protein
MRYQAHDRSPTLSRINRKLGQGYSMEKLNEY